MAQPLRDASVRFETAFISSDPVQCMLDLIELHHCDMVLMGSRALGPLHRLIEGASVSRRLVEDSPVPALLVKPPAED